MENLNQPLDTGFGSGRAEGGLHITEPVQRAWRETANWALFFAILSFIALAFMALAVLGIAVAGGFLAFLGGAAFLALFFFPGWYLLRFSSRIKQALFHSDTASMNEGFNYFQRFYRYMGILLCVVIGFYALALVMSVGTMAFMNN